MKKLLTTRDADMMGRLHRFLRQQGVPVTVSEHGNQLELWLTQSSYLAHAKDLIQQFKTDPEAAENESSADGNRPEPASDSPLKKVLRQGGWFTAIYAGAVLLVFVLLLIPTSAEAIFNTLRISDSWDELPLSQPWRLLTPALLHFSLLHLVFNLFWWWYLGGRFERLYGTTWLILAFVFCALASNISQFYMGGPYFGGLSGVVYGLFGVAVVVAWQRPTHPLFLPPGLIGFMLIWLILGYTDLLWINVANTAHTAGLISGLVLGGVLRWLSERSRTAR
ncbi:rhomboid family intramembrane serine protease [Pseudidiomarina sp.]|uniref:rhomboid family intramembrane serine protease n=1 Tax=Pseudidiomarina sp. TaxID=2081707 RepID=UPI00299F310B|nr:rhomboid family intramembrane serine protease [Pseudidiomarina sp.]MDX1706134.1 rhomboid family intramembrane serine protease [Pseudidiomarina sp.]